MIVVRTEDRKIQPVFVICECDVRAVCTLFKMVSKSSLFQKEKNKSKLQSVTLIFN